ncbi:MAG: orotidine-5'-phosphate decarboxylase [Coriobacteriia bacterium]|nr:orotidine-5'-phosphate decarboxylase [Coriobacteriia bacterium]
MQDRIIVALDSPDAGSALAMAERLRGRARWVKVGMTLFYAEGPDIVGSLREMGFDVFVDLKLHDIPHQVRGAAFALGSLGAGMLTVHASGGADMMEAAVEGAREGAVAAGVAPPAVIAVTVLTSMDADTLASVGVVDSPADQVVGLAALARTAGVDGVVCSPREAAAMRALLGERALVVTPGVRPKWAGSDDQARVETPAAALAAGASHLVIGRPITGADDPAAAFERIVQEG